MTDLTTRVDRAADHVVVTASGEIDLATAAAFRDVSLEALGWDPITVVIDLSEVSFMDSTGLGVLVLLRRKARSRRSRLRLVVGPSTLALVRVAGLDHVFAIHPDVRSAIGTADGSA